MSCAVRGGGVYGEHSGDFCANRSLEKSIGHKGNDAVPLIAPCERVWTGRATEQVSSASANATRHT